MARRFAWFTVLFLAFFFVRLGYGYYTTPDRIEKRSVRFSASDMASEIAQPKKNYASGKYLLSGAGRSPETAVVSSAVADQKYEKTATMVIGTKDYDRDDTMLRTQIKEHGAVIQFEQNVGRSDYKTRVLQLMIGIQPESFDKFTHALRGIGRLELMEVTKVDKTNEYLDLRARRASLEATRTALVDLKRMTGTIDELVGLQYKILEVDQQLQELGVKLGDYDELNEFCTVRLALYEEYDELIYPPSVPRRIMIAFKWTAKYYLAFLAALSLFSISVFLLAAVMKIIKNWTDRDMRYEPSPVGVAKDRGNAAEAETEKEE